MENKDVQGLSPDPEGKKGNPEPGSRSSDQELQRLREDVEEVKAAKNHLAEQEKQTDSEDPVDSSKETVEQEDRQFKQDETEQTIGEFALQVEAFMKEAEAAAIERPALALLAAFSLGIIVGQMFSRR
ncbi:MAG: hypothetical protein N839_0012650 [Desulfofustis sp. PB-SRB1]|jgi:ElaB/YqjD/DUF883 family membrane-anchored ribosome-binding protein|nr:hypothetical protein [Desulfofustis sp. PB-SRB1]MBM1003248.1 hypothetical protein [Desulfofustis sp. PB-SRB1]HBH29840.1 hypothetical protein [Desulfofustis sp.]HBH31047.1 hypothetical protein [Desulfofustis sp.]